MSAEFFSVCSLCLRLEEVLGPFQYLLRHRLSHLKLRRHAPRLRPEVLAFLLTPGYALIYPFDLGEYRR